MVNAGENAKLECTKYIDHFNENEMQLTWRKSSRGGHNSPVIATDKTVYTKNNKYHIDNDFNLNIVNAAIEDNGAYVCSVLPDGLYMTIHLKVRTDLSKLKIHRIVESGHNLDVTKSKIQIKSGTRVELLCEDISQGPAKVYQWIGEKSMRRNNGIYVDESGKLVIDKADSQHAGLYQCIATNEDQKANNNGTKPLELHDVVEIVVECKY